MEESFAFFGRVHPERTNVRMDEGFELQHENEFGGVEMEIFIAGSHVLADVVPKRDVNNLHTLKNLVQSGVASLTDPLSFLQGKHIDVEIFAVITPDGYKRVFGIEYEYISEKISLDKVEEDLVPNIMDIYQTEAGAYLQRCFTDYRLAMEHPEDTGFYCFRAVESLRQVFKEEGDDDRISWKKFREATGVDRQLIEEDIQTYANPRRHGEIFAISADERKLVLETTWSIIMNFIEYMESKYI